MPHLSAFCRQLLLSVASFRNAFGPRSKVEPRGHRPSSFPQCPSPPHHPSRFRGKEPLGVSYREIHARGKKGTRGSIIKYHIFRTELYHKRNELIQRIHSTFCFSDFRGGTRHLATIASAPDYFSEIPYSKRARGSMSSTLLIGGTYQRR